MPELYPSKCSGRVTSLVVLVLLMLGVFLALGSWQLQRKGEKEQILASELQKSSLETVGLPLQLDDYSAWRYREVVVSGQYLSSQQLLLENQIREGVVGFNVFSPLQTSLGSLVLIDRGWIAQAQYREQLPDISVSELSREIRGYVYTPFGEGYRLGSVDNEQTGWPRMIQYIDYAQVSEMLGKQLLPVVVRLSPESEDGYLREWAVVAFGPERHLGYAVQWFALALAMFVIIIILMRKKNG